MPIVGNMVDYHDIMESNVGMVFYKKTSIKPTRLSTKYSYNVTQTKHVNNVTIPRP